MSHHVPEWRSECCERSGLGHIDTTTTPPTGFCAGCRDHCTFYDESLIELAPITSPDGVKAFLLAELNRGPNYVADTLRRHAELVAVASHVPSLAFAMGLRPADDIASAALWPMDNAERDEIRAATNELAERAEEPCHD